MDSVRRHWFHVADRSKYTSISFFFGCSLIKWIFRLFDSGVLHYYQYGQLYDISRKIIARSTTQDRMTKSAEYFLAGFFGLDWTKNATLELIIEEDGFNNSLNGYAACPNDGKAASSTGGVAAVKYLRKYLAAATQRFQSQISGNLTWTVTDTFALQTLCPYETVAFGYSAFCDIFTQAEWEGFEYYYDVLFYGDYGFGSPTGRAIGIGYVQELLGRLEKKLPNVAGTNANTTLDSMESTFPLDQQLYFDFSHDTNIVNILTALGIRQFAQYLSPISPPASHPFVVSHIVPFAARLNIEIIESPGPVPADRNLTTDSSSSVRAGEPTSYVHFILNQRTLPLGKSFKECGDRVDGWCELSAFIKVQSLALERSQFQKACFGNYSTVPYGNITDGAPDS
jgi:Histidine phosphatase superfamily (branch 2)